MIVGFIGLGTMGSNAARNVRRAGFEMVVHDIRPEAVERQMEPGVTAGSSPADVLARADVVVTMVFGPKEVEQVVRGPSGFLSSNCKGKYWVDMTTSSPRLMRALAAEVEAQGGHAVDAPVTGSVDAAIRGDMPMFVGGEDTSIEHVRPVIEAMGQLRKVGRYGNGYVAKLVNNQLWKIHAAAIRGSGRTHARADTIASVGATRLARIQRARWRRACLISVVTGRISVRSASDAGLRRSACRAA